MCIFIDGRVGGGFKPALTIIEIRSDLFSASGLLQNLPDDLNGSNHLNGLNVLSHRALSVSFQGANRFCSLSTPPLRITPSRASNMTGTKNLSVAKALE